MTPHLVQLRLLKPSQGLVQWGAMREITRHEYELQAILMFRDLQEQAKITITSIYVVV